ncbi:MAG: 1-phosphofructokinase family hexose kinase [Isosphaeraceae bacterium]
MILCVTLNPCLDKTLTVPPWQAGESVRGTEVGAVVGGKGNNVARALKRLGRPARPVTFLGGLVGGRCESLMREVDQFDPLVTPTASETRVILTVRTEGTTGQTAFFDPDPAVTPEEAAALYHRVEGALGEGRVEAITLSGSSPSASTRGLYSDLIALARARGVPVLLDTYGPALDAIWGFWPEAIQLNRREASIHLRKPEVSGSDLRGLLDKWARRGVDCGIVTDGPNPARVRYKGTHYQVTPPPIEVVNPIGSGDCLLAGLADARLSGLSPLDAIRHAFACAGANAVVWDAGAIDPEKVRLLRESVEVETVGG